MTYRYLLSRDLGVLDHIGCLGWVMLNPSTADESRDDPTIRKVRGFTLRAGYGSFRVANLFPMRATSPKNLHAASEAERMGHPAEQADEAVELLCRDSSAVVLAWGMHGGRYPKRVRRVAEIVVASGRPAYCILGQTRNGQPRHPLMAPYADLLVPVDEWVDHVAKGGRP